MAPPEPITPVRKSGRMRQPNKKYSAEIFAGLDILSSASEEEVEARIQFDISDHDEDFDETRLVEEEAIDEEEDDILSAEAMSDGSGIATPMEESDDIMSGDEDQPGDRGLSSTSRRKSHPKIFRHSREVGTHMRGIADPSGGKVGAGPKSDYLYALFGDAIQDVIHMARSRDQWCDAVTLPRRSNETGSRGMHHFFSHPEEKRLWEATVGWNWYYVHGGRQYLGAMQRSHPFSPKEANRYIPQPSHSYRTLFMGPYGRQTRFDLPTLQSVALREAWEQAPQPNDDEAKGPGKPKRKPPREGWLLNVGTGVRCLDWAPNHTGDTQYLALSTFQPKINENRQPFKFSPAFTPQSFPSSIQIWSFSSSEAADRKSLLDPIAPPRLRLVICCDWGDAKHLTWCPMPRKFRDKGQEEGKIPIGLLAGVWSDGHVRVIDVHLDASQSQKTQYSTIRPSLPLAPPGVNQVLTHTPSVHLTSAAFTAKPPSTLSTCLAWLSPTNLAVGHANGYLALWSIYPYPSLSPSTTSPKTNTNNPKPHLYTPLHTTYILSLTSAYPLAPHLLCSSSSSGYLRLTSLASLSFSPSPNPSSPFLSSHPTSSLSFSTLTSAHRIRSAPTQIAFSEPACAFLTLDDDAVRLWPIRRFWGAISVGRVGFAVDATTPGGKAGDGGGGGGGGGGGTSNGLCIAAGTTHSSIITGSDDGTVTVMNPIRKLLYPSAGRLSLVVFRHEYLRQNPLSEEGEKGGGKIRITEHFRGREASMRHGAGSSSGKAGGGGGGKSLEGVLVATVWEEEGMCRCVAWGRSVGVGGWCAVGMGSGLVRVEDLGIGV